MKKVILVGFFQEIVELCRNCDMDIVGVIDNQQVDVWWGG